MRPVARVAGEELPRQVPPDVRAAPLVAGRRGRRGIGRGGVLVVAALGRGIGRRGAGGRRGALPLGLGAGDGGAAGRVPPEGGVVLQPGGGPDEGGNGGWVGPAGRDGRQGLLALEAVEEVEGREGALGLGGQVGGGGDGRGAGPGGGSHRGHGLDAGERERGVGIMCQYGEAVGVIYCPVCRDRHVVRLRWSMTGEHMIRGG